MNSIIKLSNGETIVGEIVHQDDKTTSVVEPLALAMEENENGRPMMIAMSWVPLTKKINMVNLNTIHVVAIFECDEYLDKYYQNSLEILRGNEIEEGEIDLDELEDELAIPLQTSANTVH